MGRADYGSGRTGARGGLICSVLPGSPAQRAGVAAGERLVAVDGMVPQDILDWRWHADGDSVSIGLEGDSGVRREVELTREPSESWGIEFASVLFDNVRTCRNNCAFCFMTQLPKGLRPALYLRDDDFRLSFLQGNFITLTNLSDDDIERIAEQSLSPLYVSLHAVTPEVRQRLVCAREDRALERFDQLVEAGIDLHVQIVLVPGVNDGDELEKTLTWLAEREGVVSVGIVPLGYTKHQSQFDGSYEDSLAAATVIQQVQKWQFAMRERDAVCWVYLADEFYLNARAPFPTEEFYDGYPQYENGIGLVRSFGMDALAIREDLERAVQSLPAEAESVTVVTGMMAATTLAGALNALCAAGRVRLLIVPNRFFGGNVSVTGLLTGQDLVASLASDSRKLEQPTAYLLPDVILNADGVTLDDLHVDDVREQSGVDVRVVSSDAAGLLDGLKDVSSSPPKTMKE